MKYQTVICGSGAMTPQVAGDAAEVAGISRGTRARIQIRKLIPRRPAKSTPITMVEVRQEALRGWQFEELAWLALALSGLAMTALGLWSVR